MKLILVHGIWQKDSKEKLRSTWIEYIKTGFRNKKLDLKLLDKIEIVFVSYNDLRKKYHLSGAIKSQRSISSIEFDPITLTATELVAEFGKPEHTIELASKRLPNKYTPLKILAKILDGTETSIALARIFAEEVYLYRNNENYRNEVNNRFLEVIQEPCVVIGHSLGSVVTFHSLKQQDTLVSTYITLGSPLAGATFRSILEPLDKPKCCSDWINIYHKNDPVYTNKIKSIDKDIEITSKATNPHGISAYLTNSNVAQIIYDALIETSI